MPFLEQTFTRQRRHTITGGLCGIALLTACTNASAVLMAQADLRDPEGQQVGTATLRQTPAGVLLHVKFDGLPPGTHALHLHQTGECQAPSFKSAGGHYQPNNREHGLYTADGPHAGDMPNIHVPESGKLEIEVLTNAKSLADGLLSDDGSAIVVHSGGDDYTSNPAGDAGSRIACGIISES